MEPMQESIETTQETLEVPPAFPIMDEYSSETQQEPFAEPMYECFVQYTTRSIFSAPCVCWEVRLYLPN